MNQATAISAIDDSGTRGFTTTRAAADARAFRAAMRHSRTIRTLRIAIPVLLVVGTAGVMIVATLLDPLRALAKLPVDVGNLVVSGTKITMQQPRIAGYTRDARPYEVTARAAAQDVTNPNVVELQDLRAKLSTPDKTVVTMSAKNGIYNAKTEKLTLHDDIVINASNGYEGYLTEAVVDTHTSSVVSEKPVRIKFLKGTLDANRLELAESGDLMLFDKGVTLMLKLDTEVLPGGKSGGQP